MASRIAYTEAPRPRRPRQKAKDHLAYLHELPCVISGRRPVEAAHIRIGSRADGKRPTGAAEKPDDKWAIPLAPDLHREQHAIGDELAFWRSYGIDPFVLALRLWAATGDAARGEEIIREARG